MKIMVYQITLFLSFFLSIKSQIKVSLFDGKDIQIKAGFSNFGKFPYGNIQNGILEYNNSFDGCSDTFPNNYTLNHRSIVMVDSKSSNDCNWIDKIFSIQMLGGQIGIIALNYTTENIFQYLLEGDNVIQDFKFDSVTIPSMVINKDDADILKNLLMKNKKVNLEINFEIYQEDNSVTYEVFFGSGDFYIYRILEDLYNFQTALGEKIKFIPHYINFKHPYFNIENPQFIEAYLEDCVCGGRYCVDHKSTLRGRDILLENIRQQCIYDYSYKEANNIDVYWKYMINFYQSCILKNNNTILEFNHQCSEEVMKNIAIPVDTILNCFDGSFDPWGLGFSYGEKTINKILKLESKKRRAYRNLYNTQAVINQKSFYGDLNTDNVKLAICAGFKNKPNLCFEENDLNIDHSEYVWIVILIVILIIIFNLILFCYCRRFINRRVQKEMKSRDFVSEINNSVTKYNKLNDTMLNVP